MGEQRGLVEAEFKSAIVPLFKNLKIRAYLAKVKYVENITVALCLMIEEVDKKNISFEIACYFQKMFNKTETLDIIFIDLNEEKKLRKVCCPFFIPDNFQVEVPDFYLISSEGYGLRKPIYCFKRKGFLGEHPDGYLLCDIFPSINLQNEGLNKIEATQLVFASRHKDFSLFPIRQWPAYVHVAALQTNLKEELMCMKESDIKLIAWGELFCL